MRKKRQAHLLSSFKWLFYFLCVSECFACLCVCVPSACLMPREVHKMRSDSPEVELWINVNLVITGNQPETSFIVTSALNH